MGKVKSVASVVPAVVAPVQAAASETRPPRPVSAPLRGRGGRGRGTAPGFVAPRQAPLVEVDGGPDPEVAIADVPAFAGRGGRGGRGRGFVVARYAWNCSS